jgi:hypothetical protein
MGKKELETYKVVVDYSKTLSEMIRDGNYKMVSDLITDENFPIQGTGKQECELFLIPNDRIGRIDYVGYYLERLGLKPAKIEHLLAIGAAYPELQFKDPIFALGSIFETRTPWINHPFTHGPRYWYFRYYPYLPGREFFGGGGLYLFQWDFASEHYCFLAVRK